MKTCLHPSCGLDNEDHATHCWKCGTPLIPQIIEYYSETTRLLLAAAHIYNNKFYDQIDERILQNKFRAPTPEYYVDIDAVVAEFEKGRERENLRRIILLTPVLLGLISLLDSSIAVFYLALFISWLIEIGFDLNRKSYVRKQFLRSKYKGDKTIDN